MRPKVTADGLGRGKIECGYRLTRDVANNGKIALHELRRLDHSQRLTSLSQKIRLTTDNLTYIEFYAFLGVSA